jgi:hypothetical protein
MGTFTNDMNALPHFTNNYELEPMDINKDGYLDLVTINDGPQVTEHIFVNKSDGTFADETPMRLTGTANPAGADDNVAVWLDYDSDGDADLVIGSLGTDRLLANDGTGKFTLVTGATPNDTGATLGLAAADFDGDGRIDLLQGQGEIPQSLADKVQLASTMNAVDTNAPSIRVAPELSGNVLYAHIHDFVAPSHVHDFQKVVVMIGSREVPMTWAGGMLWRGAIPLDAMTGRYDVCATDRKGNQGCVSNVPAGDDAGIGGDGGTNPPGDKGGGCCEASGDQRGALVLVLVAITWRRRPLRGASRTSRAA